MLFSLSVNNTSILGHWKSVFLEFENILNGKILSKILSKKLQNSVIKPSNSTLKC